MVCDGSSGVCDGWRNGSRRRCFILHLPGGLWGPHGRGGVVHLATLAALAAGGFEIGHSTPHERAKEPFATRGPDEPTYDVVGFVATTSDHPNAAGTRPAHGLLTSTRDVVLSLLEVTRSSSARGSLRCTGVPTAYHLLAAAICCGMALWDGVRCRCPPTPTLQSSALCTRLVAHINASRHTTTPGPLFLAVIFSPFLFELSPPARAT
ncbi:hypothetical protein B0H16DRAFT_1769211 [Mycena metata]|uniref:Uncharacterized protein n=1 Tax=Mycena metata TaxID=1033252 RepID=A0AAD7JUQ4_9AGAR|nr:hypothetical protein B0H16DRAFT_1769211 [Mycena metata]